MNNMYKIAVIGDYETVCGFSALGLDVYFANTPEEAKKNLKSLVENEFGIIYITENYIEQMPLLFEKYKERPIPAIIPLPSVSGSTGFGMENVKKCVEQAVGSDIIFNDDKQGDKTYE